MWFIPGILSGLFDKNGNPTAYKTLLQSKQQAKQLAKKHRMKQVKQLVLALVAMLIQATNTARAETDKLLALREEFKEKSKELEDALAEEAKEDADEQQEDEAAAKEKETQAAEIDELTKALEEALANASAAKPPTEDHLATVEKLFEDADGDGKADE